MNIRNNHVLAVVSVAALLAGCAVPQPALDQANSIANLVQEMHAQVVHLRVTQNNIAANRTAVMTELLTSKERFDREASDFQDIELSDGSAEGRLFASLKALSDARAQRAAQSEANLVELDAKLSKLLTAVPDTDKIFSAVQKELGVLGLQRNSQEQRDLGIAYLKTLRSDWETNKTPTVPTGTKSAAPAASAPEAPEAPAAPAAPAASSPLAAPAASTPR